MLCILLSPSKSACELRINYTVICSSTTHLRTITVFKSLPFCWYLLLFFSHFLLIFLVFFLFLTRVYSSFYSSIKCLSFFILFLFPKSFILFILLFPRNFHSFFILKRKSFRIYFIIYIVFSLIHSFFHFNIIFSFKMSFIFQIFFSFLQFYFSCTFCVHISSCIFFRSKFTLHSVLYFLSDKI